ncbi:Aquaporin TIP3-1 [Blattella germanica]|nr:Aquaporin TIP3-1 [Blattella germanica]
MSSSKHKVKFLSWDGLIGRITWIELLQRLVAEFIGIIIVILIGCWTQGMDKYLTPDALLLCIVSGFGFAIMMVVEIIGHISLACINPAVTLTFVVLGIIKPGLALLYCLSQCLGGIAGALILYAPYTSCCINPARAFGPALIANYWKDHWLYWMGPLCGSLVVSVFYRFVFFLPPKRPDDDSQVEKEEEEAAAEREEEIA